MAYSLDDPTVIPEKNAAVWCDALRGAGVPVEEKVYNIGDHWWGSWPDYPEALFEWLAGQ